jgi:hypothetical protein
MQNFSSEIYCHARSADLENARARPTLCDIELTALPDAAIWL